MLKEKDRVFQIEVQGEIKVILFSYFPGTAVKRHIQGGDALLSIQNIGTAGIAFILIAGDVKSSQVPVKLQIGTGFPIQDAADRIALIDAVPEIDDMVGILDIRALECRDKKTTFIQFPY